MGKAINESGALYRIGELISSERTTPELLTKILNIVYREVGADIGCLRSFDGSTDELKVISFTSQGKGEREETDLLRSGEGIARKSIQKAEIQVVRDTKKDPELRYSSFIKKEKISSLLSAPLIIRSKPAGVITFYFRKAQKFSGEEIKSISTLVCYLSLAMDDFILQDRVEILDKLASVDTFTRLYNQRCFKEMLNKELSEALRFKYTVCLAMIEVDNFKEYTDAYGCQQGNLALKEISSIIRRNVSAYDTAAKLEGEEFSVVLPHATNKNTFQILEKIRKEILDYPFDKKNRIRISISAGLATFPTNARTASNLLERANQALYLAKKEGCNRIAFSLHVSRESIKFGFCPPTLSPFYRFVLKGAREIAEETGIIDIVIGASESEWDYEGQLTRIKDVIENKVDVIAICSKVGRATKLQIEKAAAMGMPVFIFNIMEEMPSDKVISYIGYDQKEAGKEVGRYLARLLRNKGKVAIIEGLRNEPDSIQRKEGFLEAVRDFNGIKVVASEPADWMRGKARAVAGRILKSYPDLDAFFGLSDEMVLGAVEAVEEGGKKGSIFTVGLDGNQDAFHSIKHASLTATLNTNPKEIGRILMRSVIRSMIKEEKIPRQVYSPVNMVDMVNVDQYIMS